MEEDGTEEGTSDIDNLEMMPEEPEMVNSFDMVHEKPECPNNQVWYGDDICLPCIQTCGSKNIWCARVCITNECGCPQDKPVMMMDSCYTQEECADASEIMQKSAPCEEEKEMMEKDEGKEEEKKDEDDKEEEEE